MTTNDTRLINQNFRIKVFGLTENGKVNTLVGVDGLINLVGMAQANKMINRAFNSLGDVCHCKLRRGLKVSFYCK